MAMDRAEQTRERINKESRIIEIITRLHHARVPISIHFADHNQRYNSAVLEVDPLQKTITLDGMVPSDGHSRARARGEFRVTAKLSGATVYFRGRLITVIDDPEPRYVTALPDELVYEQRRSSFRVQVGMGMIVPLIIEDEDGTTFHGYLFDISSNGIGAYVEISATISLEKTYHCKVDLPDGRFVAGEAEIRFLKQNAKLNQLHVGARFINLPGPQRHTLDQFVMVLQREAIKRSRND